MKPLVSIVIPAYNAAGFLRETIGSVISQTYPNWELIIIDDGSTDTTADIAKSYVGKDNRIRYTYQINQKMASARNAGIRQARGKYVAFLDADNLFLKNKLEDQVTFMEKHPECGVSYAKIHYFYGNNTSVLYKNDQPQFSGNIFEKVLPQNFINVLTVLVRKDFFDKFGAFKEGWYACDEHYVWINLAYHGAKFYYLDKVVGLLRLHGTNDSYRSDYLIRTAEQFPKMVEIVESWFSDADQKKYSKTIERLRVHWRQMKLLGVLLKTPPFSWVLMPLFLFYRKSKYERL